MEVIDIPGLREVTDRIVHGYNPDKIVLFGSWARGTAHEGSDLDLLIIKSDGEQPRRKRAVEVLKLLWSRQADITVQPIVLTPGEWQRYLREGHSFYTEIQEEGVVVYERA